MGACSSSATSSAPSVAPTTAASVAATAAPTTAASAAASVAASVAPSVGPAALGPMEKALNLVTWAGYVVGGTGGEQVQGYDWVTPFEQQTGCKVDVEASASTRPTWSS